MSRGRGWGGDRFFMKAIRFHEIGVGGEKFCKTPLKGKRKMSDLIKFCSMFLKHIFHNLRVFLVNRGGGENFRKRCRGVKFF